METKRILSFADLKWAVEHQMELPKGARLGPKLPTIMFNGEDWARKMTRPLDDFVDDITIDGKDLLVTPRGQVQEIRLCPGDRLRCLPSVLKLAAGYRGPVESRLGCGRKDKIRYGNVPQSGPRSGFVRHPKGIAAVEHETCSCSGEWHSSYCTFWLQRVYVTPDRTQHQAVADWLDKVLP